MASYSCMRLLPCRLTDKLFFLNKRFLLLKYKDKLALKSLCWLSRSSKVHYSVYKREIVYNNEYFRRMYLRMFQRIRLPRFITFTIIIIQIYFIIILKTE